MQKENKRGGQGEDQGVGPGEGAGSKTTKTAEWAGVILRLAVGSVFIVSGFLKLMKPAASFAAVIEAYQLVPPEATIPMASVLPWIEFLLGGCLITGYITRWSAVGAASLLAVFIAALGSVWLRGINLNDCGCFGGLGIHFTPGQAIFFDLFLLTTAGWVIKFQPKRLSLDSWIEKGKA